MDKQNAEISIEEALMQELRFGGLAQDNLQDLVQIVADLQKMGLKKIKPFPKGIPNPDGLRLTGVLEADQVNQVLGDILLKTPRLGAVVLFPLGIPWPEIFRINIDLGNPVELEQTRQF